MAKREAAFQLTQDNFRGAHEQDDNDPSSKATMATPDAMRARRIKKPVSRLAGRPGFSSGATGSGGFGSAPGSPFGGPGSPNVNPFGNLQTPTFGAGAGSPAPNASVSASFGGVPSTPGQQNSFGASSTFNSFPPPSSPAPMFGQGQNTGNLFGTPAQNQNQPSGGMFGQQPQQQTNMFGTSTPAAPAPSTPSLFGQSQPAQQDNKPLFSTPSNFNFGGSSSSFQFTSGGTAPSTPAPSGNIGFTFGATPSQPPQAPSTPAASTPFAFTAGSGAPSTPAPAANLFGAKPAETPKPLFGAAQSTQPSVTPSTGAPLFGGNTSTSFTPKAPAPTTGNLFGAPSTPKPDFTFGAQPAAAKTEETPKPNPFANIIPNKPAETLKPLFGAAPAASTTPSQEKPNPFSSLPSSTPSGSLFGAKPAETPSKPLFGNASATPAAASSLFGKPAETPKPAASTSLFGKPAEAAAPAIPTASSLFGKPAEDAPSTPAPALGGSLFGKPAETPKAENPFGKLSGIVPNKTEETPKPAAAAPLFGTPKPVGAPLFGAKPAEETPKPASTSNLFGKPAAPTPSSGSATASLFASIADKDDKPAEAPKPLFGAKAPEPAPAAAPVQATPKKPSPPGPLGTPAKPPPSATGVLSRPEPTTGAVSYPNLPSLEVHAPSHYTADEKEKFMYMYQLRSLNTAFLKRLQEADPYADWSAMAKHYEETADKLKRQMHKSGPMKRGNDGEDLEGERGAKRGKAFGDAPVNQFIPPATPAPQPAPTKKRKSDGDEEDEGSKRNKMAAKPLHGFKPPSADAPKSDGGFRVADKPLFGFKPPTPAASAAKKEEDSNKLKLADKPMFGFTPPSSDAPKKTEGSIKMADKPLFGFQPPKPAGGDSGSSIFSAGAKKQEFKNPFAHLSGTDKGENDVDKDDEGDSSEEKEKPKTNGSSLFGTPSKGDLTWKPDSPIRFGAASSTTPPSLFAPKPSTTASSAASPSPAPTSRSASTTPAPPATSSSTDSATANEPSDAVPTTTTDFSSKGAGEEHETTLFEKRCSLYLTSPPSAPKKVASNAKIRINTDPSTGKSRILVRGINGKVVLNVALGKGLNLNVSPKDMKAVLVPDFSKLDDKGKGTLYIARFKEVKGAEEFVEKAMGAKAK